MACYLRYKVFGSLGVHQFSMATFLTSLSIFINISFRNNLIYSGILSRNVLIRFSDFPIGSSPWKIYIFYNDVTSKNNVVKIWQGNSCSSEVIPELTEFAIALAVSHECNFNIIEYPLYSIDMARRDYVYSQISILQKWISRLPLCDEHNAFLPLLVSWCSSWLITFLQFFFYNCAARHVI